MATPKMDSVLDVIAAMDKQWRNKTEDLMCLTAALIAIQAGVAGVSSSVVVRIDDVQAMLEKWDVSWAYDSTSKGWLVKYSEKTRQNAFL